MNSSTVTLWHTLLNTMINSTMIKSASLLSLFIVSMVTSSELLAQNSQRLAAYEGNPEAQFKLALAYSQDKTNYPLAAYWYTQAARQGMPNAQYNLGHFYLQGIGVKQDTSKTIKWWKQAAHQNYPQAQHNIGTAYFEGIGVEKNPQLAKQWFERCAELGSAACIKSLAVVKENMPSPEARISIKPTEQDVEKDIQGTISDSAETSTITITNNNSTNASEAEPGIESKDVSLSAHIQANLNSTIIAQINDRNDFTVIGQNDSNDWQQIQLNKAVPIWCYKKYVSLSESQQTGKLIGDKVRARTEPSTKTGKVITELSRDTELRVLQVKENWVQLALTNHIAWTPVIEEKTIVAKADSDATNDTTLIKNTSETKTADTIESITNAEITIKSPKKLNSGYAFFDQRSDDDWLFKSDPKQFTLLLGNFDNSKTLTQFAGQINFSKNSDAHLLLAKRDSIEWKYVLYGNFNDKESAMRTIQENGFSNAYIERIGNIQEQRCSAWKTTIPSPKKLPIYCLKKTTFNS